MTTLAHQLWQFEYQGHPVRTALINDEPWWVARDVCEVLEIGDTRRAVQRLDEDERSTAPVIDSLGRKQETYIINEPGLYALILTSRKPEAKRFKRWITHEVLPAIRKTGQYTLRPGSGTDTSDARQEITELRQLVTTTIQTNAKLVTLLEVTITRQGQQQTATHTDGTETHSRTTSTGWHTNPQTQQLQFDLPGRTISRQEPESRPEPKGRPFDLDRLLREAQEDLRKLKNKPAPPQAPPVTERKLTAWVDRPPPTDEALEWFLEQLKELPPTFTRRQIQDLLGWSRTHVHRFCQALEATGKLRIISDTSRHRRRFHLVYANPWTSRATH